MCKYNLVVSPQLTVRHILFSSMSALWKYCKHFPKNYQHAYKQIIAANAGEKANCLCG